MTINQTTPNKVDKLSPAAYQALCNFEGYRSTSYQCSAGVLTIGYGHTKGVKRGDKVTKFQAMQLLEEDLQPIYKELQKYGLQQSQFDALADLIFNIGLGNWLKSTIRSKVKANNKDKTIANEFKRWRYCNGKLLPGLVRRREWESRRYYEDL